jgi:hypothetical protein
LARMSAPAPKIKSLTRLFFQSNIGEVRRTFGEG